MSTLSNTTKPQSDRSPFSQDRSKHKADLFHNAILAILEPAQAIEVIRYKKNVGKGRVYWAYYKTFDGKKRATFISPKEFQGYRWNAKYSEVTNLETGAVYQVSDRHCTCQFWHWKVRTGLEYFFIKGSPHKADKLLSPADKLTRRTSLNKNNIFRKKRSCKHQDMRAEFEGKSLKKAIAPQKETIHIDPNNPPAGCILRRTDDWMSAEYDVLFKSPNPSNDSPETKLLGRVVEQKDGIFAIAHQCKTGVMTWDISEARRYADPLSRIAYLLYCHGMNYKQLNEAEQDKTAIEELNETKANEFQQTPSPNDGFGGFYSLAI
ncbi:MAG: hypothetical protein QNJ54_29330 [Prochloraceae cyanobacterium]|nr:hypothetical protein [Prochloraceae cyanobacterium]